MKDAIHPKYYPDAKVSCVCGNAFITGSTQPEIRVDICSMCHPLYTGKQKFVDTQGQVEKFSKSLEVSSVKKAERAKIEEVRASKVKKVNTQKPSLKDLLLLARKKAAS